MKTKVIVSKYLEHYKQKQPNTIQKHFNNIKETPMNSDSFGFQLSIDFKELTFSNSMA